MQKKKNWIYKLNRFCFAITFTDKVFFCCCFLNCSLNFPFFHINPLLFFLFPYRFSSSQTENVQHTMWFENFSNICLFVYLFSFLIKSTKLTISKVFFNNRNILPLFSCPTKKKSYLFDTSKQKKSVNLFSLIYSHCYCFFAIKLKVENSFQQ